MSRLDDIKAREQAATKGWWRHRSVYQELDDVVVEDDLEIVCSAAPENARFIAHAREDIPWLVAEVERLESVLLELAAAERKI